MDKLEICLKNYITSYPLNADINRLHNIPGASFTPSPVMADISFIDCRYSTILDLWNGSTLANIRELATAVRCSLGDNSSNSLPIKAYVIYNFKRFTVCTEIHFYRQKNDIICQHLPE